MKNKPQNRNKFLDNELDWLDPDQKLTYNSDEENEQLKPHTLKESLSRGFRSILAVILCVVVPLLWYFDWNPSAFADETAGFVTGIFEEAPSAPIAPLPPVPEIVSGDNALDMSMVDYAAALNEEGLLDVFSSPAVSAFYENGVTIEYLMRLREAGLAEEFSFPAVIAFYQNNIPLEFLNSLQSQQLLSELSFPAVVAFYQNEVTVEYLNQLRDSELLSDLSFPAVVAFYTNGVTIEFLTDLRERQLLQNLSFPDIVNMYQSN